MVMYCILIWYIKTLNLFRIQVDSIHIEDQMIVRRIVIILFVEPPV